MNKGHFSLLRCKGTVRVKEALVHQMGHLVLITCSDLSPYFSMEPLMKRTIKNSCVVYVNPPREAQTVLQKAHGLT